jgi:hypothetical protein
VEVLQLPPSGGCSGHDPGAATKRLVGTRSAKRAVTTGGSAATNTHSSAADSANRQNCGWVRTILCS